LRVALCVSALERRRRHEKQIIALKEPKARRPIFAYFFQSSTKWVVFGSSVETVTIDPLDLQAAQDQDVGTLSMRHEMALSQEERHECRDHSEVQRERRVS